MNVNTLLAPWHQISSRLPQEAEQRRDRVSEDDAGGRLRERPSHDALQGRDAGHQTGKRRKERNHPLITASHPCEVVFSLFFFFIVLSHFTFTDSEFNLKQNQVFAVVVCEQPLLSSFLHLLAQAQVCLFLLPEHR